MSKFNSSHLSARFMVLALIAVSALFLSSVAFAQTTVSTGSIVGIVTDATGAVVPAAKVTIIGSTGQTIHAVTSGTGSYSSGALVPGAYKVRVEAKGFKTAQLSLDVQVDNTANGGVKLELGQESTVIDVQASEVTVNTEQAEVQGVLNSNQIENLPVNGRNFLDLAQLEPGVQIQDGTNFDPTKVGYSSISFGGRFGRTARIEVDGVDVSDETVGTTTEDIPASSIQEFSVAQSNLDLSNELTSSGAVNVTTKAGTNAYHGEAFGVFRDHAIGSASLPHASILPSPYFQRNQDGANFGGPILKDKAFFFLDGERTLQHLQAPVLESAPFQDYSGFFPAPFIDDELLGRIDYQLTKTARLFGRFSYFKNSTDATFFPTSFQVYNNRDVTRNTVAGADFNTGTFTHTIRFSYLKFQNQIVDGTRGTDLPFANYPVSINIGSFTVGPNLLAPQTTPQSDHQLKYDGSKALGKHILRFGVSWNHIQGGGQAAFFGTSANVFGAGLDAGCAAVSATCPAGPDGTTASNPLNYDMVEAIVSNGQGYSTLEPALGFPAGGLGPDNRLAFYFGDSWKILPNLTLSPGLRWARDTGRTDSDLGPPGCPAAFTNPCIPLNSAFPGYGNPVHQPNQNWAPQLGIAWDPAKNGKTVIRAGAGLFYENVIFNNVLFDRPLREPNGAFLYDSAPCFGGSAFPLAIPGGVITPTATDCGTASGGLATIAATANGVAGLETQLKAAYPFSPGLVNGSYVGGALAAGQAPALGLFAPNYISPRSIQMNIGIQREIRHGMVLTADFLRNVETHALLGVDINHVGSADSQYFSATGAADAVMGAANTYTPTGTGAAPCAGLAGAPAVGCLDAYAVQAPTTAEPNLGAAGVAGAYLGNGLGTPGDATGVACLNAAAGGVGHPCAFGGINQNYNSMLFLEPISRSVYNGLQMKLVQNVTNPLKGVKAANFQLSYALSRFVNPEAFQGLTAPSNAVSANDQDFVLQAGDNDHPLRYMGPSLLDRTHQISFGGNIDVPFNFRLGIIAHFYSPLSSPAIVGSTGSTGQIFQTDFTGSGFVSDPLPGTKNGAFGRSLDVNGLNNAISSYNTTQGGQPTPAGQQLVSAGLFTPGQLADVGLVAPILSPAPPNQLPFTWTKALDFKIAWEGKIKERFTIEPSVGFYNIFNFSNFNLPPGTMTGWLDQGANSINSTAKGFSQATQSVQSDSYRVGVGTGVFGLGGPRVMEFQLKVSF
ncbi:MAG: carboxypeptidase regulatory-like domain-containing protein [Candidatus Sulfotelmatobacter sp.]